MVINSEKKLRSYLGLNALIEVMYVLFKLEKGV